MARLDPAVPTEKVDGRRAARLLTSHATIARCHRQRGGQARFTFAAMPRSVRGLGEEHDAAGLQSKRIRFQRPRGAPLRGPQKEHLHFGIRLKLPPAPITRRVMSPRTWKVRSVAHQPQALCSHLVSKPHDNPNGYIPFASPRFSTYPEEVRSGIAAPQPSASSRKANDQFRAAMSWAQLRKAAP